MLNPSIGKLINNTDNRYELVLNIAHDARKVADKMYENSEDIIVKPVSVAIDNMAAKLGLDD